MEWSKALALYEKLIATHPAVERKGDKMPYTSLKQTEYVAVFLGALLTACAVGPDAPPTAAPHPEGLDVEARWAPLDHSTYGFQRSCPLLKGLAPAQPTRHYTDTELAAFAPPRDATVGATWRLDEARLLPFVRQLHAKAQLEMHAKVFDAEAHRGGYAILAGRDERLDEVLFRLHADFPLDERGSWYTPAQFAGRVVYERASGHALSFVMALPPRDSNVDLNWAHGDGIEADIGFVPRLDLVAASVGGEGGKRDDAAHPTGLALDEATARQRLARCFYAFAQIDWLPLDEAVVEARESGRPLHLVVLFGTLDDESC